MVALLAMGTADQAEKHGRRSAQRKSEGLSEPFVRFKKDDVDQFFVRGQYDAGVVDEKHVPCLSR